jgi:hypothetical protein
MKTPREILLGRHRATDTKLDAIRTALVRSLAAEQSAVEEGSAARIASAKGQDGGRVVDWRQWLGSLRWHLAGLGGAWLAIVLLNVDHSGASAPATIAERQAPPPERLVMAMRENRRQILELIGPPVQESPPAISPPGRRSERFESREMA